MKSNDVLFRLFQSNKVTKHSLTHIKGGASYYSRNCGGETYSERDNDDGSVDKHHDRASSS